MISKDILKEALAREDYLIAQILTKVVEDINR
jgi:hypothetical protein